MEERFLVKYCMYLGALIALVGTPLSLGSWWGLIILIPYVPGIIWRLLDEEKFLSKNLQGYDEYRQKVRYTGCLKTKLDSTIVTKFSTIRSINLSLIHISEPTRPY